MIIITDRNRGYSSRGDRARAIASLRRHGFNYFVCYRDVQSTYALQYGRAAWVPAGDYHVDR